MEVGLPNLPDEIVSDILSRLPVKSLCRFKSVSKTWLARTIDPQFIKLHLSQSMKYSTTQKLIISPDPVWGQISKPFYSMDYQAPDHTLGLLDMPYKSSAQILGSFNGVILLDIDEELCLWNPSIRMYRKFSPPKCADVPSYNNIIYGLGYDSNSDDIKVIAVFTVSGAGSVVFVFSSKLSSWERTGDFGYGTFLFEPGCVLNGAPHWFSRGPTDSYYHIVYFDLVEEKFKEVPQPIYEVEDNPYILGVLHGWLCVVNHCPQRNSNVWVMKEYGVKESWTKLLVVPSVPALPGEVFPGFAELLCFTEGGEVIMKLGPKQLFIYSPTQNIYKRIGINYVCSEFVATLYVETLVSPYGCNNT